MGSRYLHETYWNVSICQNLIDRGVPPYFAILAVPLTSCIVHGITSNWRQGVRCAPQFCWVTRILVLVFTDKYGVWRRTPTRISDPKP